MALNDDSKRIYWEASHNCGIIDMYDEDMGIEISVDPGVLIEPYAYSSPQLNARRRAMAIEQKVFEKYPGSDM